MQKIKVLWNKFWKYMTETVPVTESTTGYTTAVSIEQAIKPK